MSEGQARERVFIDASVWIAASASPEGGSSVSLEICQGKRYMAVCSQRVLMEAQTNIRHKMPIAALVRFYELLAAVGPEIVSEISAEEEEAWADVVAPKDAHVLAAAVIGRANYLLTLDRKHLANDTLRAAVAPLQVLLPGEFIHRVMPKT